MNDGRTVGAWCAGRPVTVPVKASPPDHRRVPCPSCGRPKGQECADLTLPGATLWAGHATRRAADRKRFGP